MRRTNHGDERETGLSAAFKAMVVALAVGVLALVAGQAAYAPSARSVESPAYMPQGPARDDVPFVSLDSHLTEGIENRGAQMLAAGPAGISSPELRIQEQSTPMASSAQVEDPVATF